MIDTPDTPQIPSTDEYDEEVLMALNEVVQGTGYGSIEIFVTGGKVTQITVRKIKKVR